MNQSNPDTKAPETSLPKASELAVLIPVLAGYFVLYGAVNLMTYYGAFGVQIISYIGFSEIISYFIKDIRTVLIQVLWIGVSYPLFYNRIKALGTKLDKFEKDLDSVRKKPQKASIADIIIVVAGVLMFGFFFIWDGWRTGLIALFILLMIAPIITYTAHIPQVVIVLLTFVCFTLMSFVEAKRRADNVLDGVDYGVEFKIDDQLIKSDSVGCFIGKTERYIFYYDRTASKTIVYPVEKLQYMSIPKDGYIKVQNPF